MPSQNPSHQRVTQRMLLAVMALAALIPIIILAPSLPGTSGIAKYAPLHTFLETISISISAMIFAIGLATQKDYPSLRIRWIAYLLLGTAILDFSHMISYAGMPDFVTPSGAEKAINFWLAARLFSALALLGAALIPHTAQAREPYHLLPVVTMLALSFFHVWFLFYPATVPPTFILGVGLTDFKRNAEYVIILLFIFAAAIFLRNIFAKRDFTSEMLFGAALIFAMAEMYFTLYADITDIYNLTGHLYKIAGYYYLYLGIFIAMVRIPFSEMRKAKKQLQSTFAALPDMVIETDPDGICQTIHSKPKTLPNLRTEKLQDKPITELLDIASGTALEEVLSKLLQPGESETIPIAISNNGAIREFDLTILKLSSEQDGSQGALLIGRDVTEKNQRDAEILRLSYIMDNSPLPIVITDPQGCIEYVNTAFTRISGYTREEASGQNAGFIKSGKTPISTYQDMWSTILKGRIWEGELYNQHKNGQGYIERCQIFPIKGPDGHIKNYMAYKEDVTQQKFLEERLTEVTKFDRLTGIPNTLLVEQRFERAISAPFGHTAPITVMLIGLDQFRLINNALGIDCGDILLKEIAMRLQEVSGPGNTIGRDTGDAFIGLFPGMTAADAACKAQELLNRINQSIFNIDEELMLTCSIGIAISPSDGKTFAELKANAEAAMIVAKAEGRNRYHFFAPALQDKAIRRHAVGNALRLAVENNQFHLVFQPKFCLRSNRCTGAEALLRWNHPTLGTVSPQEFIAIAEDQGTIEAIGTWVSRAVFQYISDLGDAPEFDVPISINISALELTRHGLSEKYLDLSKEFSVAPDRINFEITESIAMRAPELALGVINDLRKNGFIISLDDFGTGYSSFAYLRIFNANLLKIDISFVRHLETDLRDRAIVNAIIQLAHILGMRTVAEGVETEDQVKILRDLGCDEVQGFFFSKPLSQKDFRHFLREHASTSR